MILDAPVWCVKSLQVKHNCLLKKNTKYEQEQLDKQRACVSCTIQLCAFSNEI